MNLRISKQTCKNIFIPKIDATNESYHIALKKVLDATLNVNIILVRIQTAKRHLDFSLEYIYIRCVHVSN